MRLALAKLTEAVNDNLKLNYDRQSLIMSDQQYAVEAVCLLKQARVNMFTNIGGRALKFTPGNYLIIEECREGEG